MVEGRGAEVEMLLAEVDGHRAEVETLLVEVERYTNHKLYGNVRRGIQIRHTVTIIAATPANIMLRDETFPGIKFS